MDCPDRTQSAVAGDLPEDPLTEILARVPIRCLYRSKCVAKTWRDLIEGPFHRKKLPQTLQGFFMIKHENCGLHIDYVSLLAIARSAPLEVDPSHSLSFLTEFPGYEALTFLDSCNGLLLFERKHKSSPFDYVVWNPATKQWGEVPRSGSLLPSMFDTERCTCLVFDPAISRSSHFHLVQFLSGWKEEEEEKEVFLVDYFNGEGNVDDGNDDTDECFFSSVHVYSSETGQWVHVESDQYGHDLRWHDQRVLPCQRSLCALLNGMLHFLISRNQIVVVDVRGVTRKIIPVPKMMTKKKCWLQRGYVAQSQGCLHYLNQGVDAQLLIWVLEDYDTQKWVLKHNVSFMELFGKKRRPCRPSHKYCYRVVGMHPDGNVVFIVQYWDLKLISYDMDHKLVSVIGTLENGASSMDVVPYVPCYSELSALTNKH